MLKRLALLMVATVCLLVPAVAFAHDHDPKRIMAAELMAKLNAGEDIVIIDTRTTASWAVGNPMIINAQRVKDNESLTKLVRQIPLERTIVTYCT
ncbi:MAG TPA: hypothetical protein VIR78_13370 [Malonomonas sp.]